MQEITIAGKYAFNIDEWETIPAELIPVHATGLCRISGIPYYYALMGDDYVAFKHRTSEKFQSIKYKMRNIAKTN